MSELDDFKAKIEQFLSTTELTPTAFGKRFAGDPRFVFQIRDGREPRSKTRLKVLHLMEQANSQVEVA